MGTSRAGPISELGSRASLCQLALMILRKKERPLSQQAAGEPLCDTARLIKELECCCLEKTQSSITKLGIKTEYLSYLS
jgi:hypothetical protein